MHFSPQEGRSQSRDGHGAVLLHVNCSSLCLILAVCIRSFLSQKAPFFMVPPGLPWLEDEAGIALGSDF